MRQDILCFFGIVKERHQRAQGHLSEALEARRKSSNFLLK